MHIAGMRELCCKLAYPTAFGPGTGRQAELFAPMPVDYVGDVAGAAAVGVDGNAADGSVASNSIAKLNLRRNAWDHHRKRKTFHAWRWYRKAGCHSLQEPRRRAWDSLRPGDEIRRSLYGRQRCRRRGLDRRCAGCHPAAAARWQAAAFCPTAMVHALSLPSVSAI